MLFLGGAAYTAFLSFGARHYLAEILPGMWQVLPWVAPTLLAAIAVQLYQRKYAPKVERA
jgi:hypothetical protein